MRISFLCVDSDRKQGKEAIDQVVLRFHQAKTLEVCRKLGISGSTYYRWRKEYGGPQIKPGSLPFFTLR